MTTTTTMMMMRSFPLRRRRVEVRMRVRVRMGRMMRRWGMMSRFAFGHPPSGLRAFLAFGLSCT
jgi:hypothetical protein